MARTRKTRIVSVDKVIKADPSTIFDLLADPSRHQIIDGSDTVKASRSAEPNRLELGAKFGMHMKLGIPYRITNEVVEFEEGRLIGWRHLGHHIWRYELSPTPEGTLVTESFDWASSRFPPYYEWTGYPRRHIVNMTRTLEKLAEHLEASI